MAPYLLIALLLAIEPASADPVALDEAALWAEAGALEQQGAYEAAAQVFAPLADAYPQDYAIQLQAAWLAFSAGDYARAETGYARAIELSQGAAEARSGLAWTHLRQAKPSRARREFEALLAEHPGLASAEAGLDELRQRRFIISPIAHGIGHIYAGHPTLDWAIGTSVSLPMVIAEHVLVIPSYRFAHFLPRDVSQGMGMMAGQGGNTQSVPAFDQHEAHLGVGVTWPRVGALAQYAYLNDGSQAHDHAHVVGLSLRYSPWGDGILDVSAAGFRSGWIGRLAPAWRMPVTRWLNLQPGFALQLVGREVLPSGFGSLVFHGRTGALVLGGKGGLEERPVYLETPAIFAFAGRITWGAWIAGSLRLGKGVDLRASYETHHLRAPDGAGGIAPTQVHYIALGLRWTSARTL